VVKIIYVFVELCCNQMDLNFGFSSLKTLHISITKTLPQLSCVACVVTLVYKIRMFKVNKFDNKHDLFTGRLFTV